MFALLSDGGVARNWPCEARNSRLRQTGECRSWRCGMRNRDALQRCGHMPTKSTDNTPTPTTDRLWKDADIATYLRCSDPTQVTNLPGFPARLVLPGVRGGRWYGAHVIAFFERLSTASAAAPTATSTAEERPSIPAFEPTAKKAVA